MRRDGTPIGTLRRGLVAPEWKVVYVPTPKAGATSFKWMMAEINGEDLGAFTRADGPWVTRALNVHDRTLWRRTPTLGDLSDEQLDAISPANGWFVFAMVRHPTTRLWSAWQSKLLLREANFFERFGDRPWFPRVPRSLGEVAEDFEAFATALADEPGLIDADLHWRHQHVQVDTEAVPFAHVGRLENFPETRARLEQHLLDVGWRGTLQSYAENETPLPLTAGLLSEAAAKAAYEVYRRDFDQFGYGRLDAGSLPSLPTLERALVGEVGRLVGRAERIGDLSARLRRVDAPLAFARRTRRRVTAVLRRVAGGRGPRRGA